MNNPSVSSTEGVTLARRLLAEVGRIYVGAPRVPLLMLTSVLAGGHVLLEGVPGVAKTTLVKAFATTLGCDFRRVQFTPDLLPADITGTFVLRNGEFELHQGPVFTNVLLGDEINRAPPKTQSALLEAMAERQVTLDGQTRELPDPFLVLATQNPIEQAGTYPLPEAQTDRFLMRLRIGYPNEDEERKMLKLFLSGRPELRPIANPEVLRQLRAACFDIHVEDATMNYIVGITRATRELPGTFLGASPRTSLALLSASRAFACLNGREYVLPDDVRSVAEPVIAHRLVLEPEAELAGKTPEDMVKRVLKEIQPRR